MTGAPFVNIGPGASLPLRYATRHAGIFGATGSGKTTTAAALIERLSDAGVPVLVLDAKGDLESLTRGGRGRIWDPTGRRGAARRLSLHDMGPDLIARALDLSDAQAGVLEILHAMNEATGRQVHNLVELKATLGELYNMPQNVRDRVAVEFGLVTPSSVAAVQRSILRIQRAAPLAFGKPVLDPFAADQRDRVTGRGRITVLHAAPFLATGGLYGAAAAHILDSLYRQAGELGDTSAPALAVFIDEAHLIFQDAPRAIVQKMESVVRLIRSKGVALIFATQSPADLPPVITSQLATRIQHGLRGATRHGLAEIRAAADSMPTGDDLDAFEAIKGLGTGEALVSVPGENGRPSPARLVKIARGDIEAEPLADSELPADSHFSDALALRLISPTPRPPPRCATWWQRLRGRLSLFG